MKAINFAAILLFLVSLPGCAALDDYQKNASDSENLNNKITFDLTRLDQDGLYGDGNGKRALSYEFCIPANVIAAREVMGIDPSAVIYKNSPGRVNCKKDEYLAMGDTFQKNFLETLQQLVNIDYVRNISEVHFE